MGYRTRSIYDIDPDYRTEPKTKVYCARCQKDLKEGQPRRILCLIESGMSVLHPLDQVRYVEAGLPVEHHPVGMDCARKIGLEWSIHVS